MKRSAHLSWTEWIHCQYCGNKFSVKVSEVYADASRSSDKFFFATDCTQCEKQVILIDLPAEVQSYILRQV